MLAAEDGDVIRVARGWCLHGHRGNRLPVSGSPHTVLPGTARGYFTDGIAVAGETLELALTGLGGDEVLLHAVPAFAKGPHVFALPGG